MKEIKLRTKTIHLYEHSDEMIMQRYNDANEYALMDAEIGNTPESINRHFQKFGTYMAQKNWDALIQEYKNLYNALYNVIDKNNFIGLQFACYIKSIDDKPVTDYSHESLKRLLVTLSEDGLTMGIIRGTVYDIKKKSEPNYRQRFQSVLAGLTNLIRSNPKGKDLSPNSSL